jgi:hypothetical protein
LDITPSPHITVAKVIFKYIDSTPITNIFFLPVVPLLDVDKFGTTTGTLELVSEAEAYALQGFTSDGFTLVTRKPKNQTNTTPQPNKFHSK